MKILTISLVLLILFSDIIIAQSEPPRGLSEIQAFSVFMDAYRADDYDMAIQYGEWMLDAAPGTLVEVESFLLPRQFERMISVYSGKAEQENDPSVSSEFYQKALGVFEKAFGRFDEDEIDIYEWALKQGRFYHANYAPLRRSTDDIAAQYEKAWELDRRRFAEESNGYFVEFLLNHYASSGQREKAFAMIEAVEETASAELTGVINQVRESLFESPEERIAFYESQLSSAEDEERVVLLGKLAELYEETGQLAKATETALQLYELNRSFANAQKLSEIYLIEGNYSMAADYLKEAFRVAEDEEVKKEIALELASAYQQLQQLREARDFVRQALRIDTNFGEAYLRMASIYAGTVTQCSGGSALDRDDRTVYWLVLDYLERAKQTNPLLAPRVDSQARSYQSAMPTREDKFFRGWEPGEEFHINEEIGECYAWIDEATMVR